MLESTTWIAAEGAFLCSGLEVALGGIARYVDGQSLLGARPTLGIGWSPLELLLSKPEWAWLSHPAAEYIQLPASATLLKRAAQAHADTRRDIPTILYTPLGQMLWSLEQLESTVGSGHWARLGARADELERFAELHWPGWLGSEIEQLQRAIVSHAGALCGHRLRRLARAAGPIAVYGAFSEFFHGAGRDIVNKGPGQVQLGLKVARSIDDDERPRMVERLLDRLRGENWWVPLHDALLTVREKLDQVAQCGFDPESLLQGRLGAAVDNLESFEKIADGLISDPDTWLQKLGDAETHISVVINAMLSIESAAGILKEGLQGDDLNAPASADRRRV